MDLELLSPRAIAALGAEIVQLEKAISTSVTSMQPKNQRAARKFRHGFERAAAIREQVSATLKLRNANG